jgi:hypothetical protein
VFDPVSPSKFNQTCSTARYDFVFNIRWWKYNPSHLYNLRSDSSLFDWITARYLRAKLSKRYESSNWNNRKTDQHSTKDRQQRIWTRSSLFFLSKSVLEKFSFIKFWVHETSPSNRFFSFPKLYIPNTIKIVLCSSTRNEFCVL